MPTLTGLSPWLSQAFTTEGKRGKQLRRQFQRRWTVDCFPSFVPLRIQILIYIILYYQLKWVPVLLDGFDQSNNNRV